MINATFSRVPWPSLPFGPEQITSCGVVHVGSCRSDKRLMTSSIEHYQLIASATRLWHLGGISAAIHQRSRPASRTRTCRRPVWSPRCPQSLPAVFPPGTICRRRLRQSVAKASESSAPHVVPNENKSRSLGGVFPGEYPLQGVNGHSHQCPLLTNWLCHLAERWGKSTLLLRGTDKSDLTGRVTLVSTTRVSWQQDMPNIYRTLFGHDKS